MKTILTTLCLTALLCGTVQARLGETVAEISERYGKPLNTNPTQGIFGLAESTYLFKGYSICVNFKDGKCVREQVTPKAKQELTEDACFELVKSVGGLDWAWKKEGDFFWKRDDGANAVGDKSHFIIESDRLAKHRDAYLKQQSDNAKNEAKKKTEGF